MILCKGLDHGNKKHVWYYYDYTKDYVICMNCALLFRNRRPPVKNSLWDRLTFNTYNKEGLEYHYKEFNKAIDNEHINTEDAEYTKFKIFGEK